MFQGVVAVPHHGQRGELLGLNTAFKRQLDLYARCIHYIDLKANATIPSSTHLFKLSSVVKARSLSGVETRHSNIDTVNSFVAPIIDKVIVRESTEGEYSAIEHESVRGVVECLKVLGHTCTFKYLMIFRGDHQGEVAPDCQVCF